MASNLKIVSGGLLCGNPIVVSVTPASVPETATFHRVKLKVKSAVTGTSMTSEVEMSENVSTHDTVYIDISSALRSLIQQYPVERTTLVFPVVSYSLVSWDEYLENGEVHRTAENVLNGGSAIFGAFTDIERWAAVQKNPKATSKSVQFFSRKPKTGEIIAQDETLVIPVPFPAPISGGLTYGPLCKALSFAEKEGVQTIMYSEVYNPSTDYSKAPIKEDYALHRVYVVPPSPRRYHFYFVNSFGLIETISAECLPEENLKVQSHTHVLSRPERFESFSRSVNRKTSARHTLKMSSGPLDESWLQWWQDEFLMTSKAWIRMNGIYVPCNIIAQEDTPIRKYSTNDELVLTFSVEMDIDGGLVPVL